MTGGKQSRMVREMMDKEQFRERNAQSYNNQYRELISYACSNSDAIMMVFSYKKGETVCKVRKR